MRARIKASTSLLGILALLAACSGDDEPQASDRSPLPLPAAGRITLGFHRD